MGNCCASARDSVSLEEQPAPSFSLIPAFVGKDNAAYSLQERASWKAFFSGKEQFDISHCTGEYGKFESAMQIKQSAWDFGKDRMELKEYKTGKVVAVVRRARASLGDCFYIYTVAEPYPGAKRNKWNEELDGQSLYCMGFLQSDWGFSYKLCLYYADAEKGPDPDGKDPYKPAYKLKAPGWFSPDTVIFSCDEQGKVADETKAAAFASRDRFQWPCANQYAVEVAPGVDAALMVMAMAMLDEIIEDKKNSA